MRPVRPAAAWARTPMFGGERLRRVRMPKKKASVQVGRTFHPPSPLFMFGLPPSGQRPKAPDDIVVIAAASCVALLVCRHPDTGILALAGIVALLVLAHSTRSDRSGTARDDGVAARRAAGPSTERTVLADDQKTPNPRAHRRASPKDEENPSSAPSSTPPTDQSVDNDATTTTMPLPRSGAQLLAADAAAWADQQRGRGQPVRMSYQRANALLDQAHMDYERFNRKRDLYSIPEDRVDESSAYMLE